MANQPTKYRKFLAGAASATLVATAIVPTALAAEVETAATDFSDVPATHTHYANVMQAVERGLFNGYTDGTFKPENTIDRKGVVKSLANYVVSQSDYKTYEEYITANKLADKVTPFNDVPATHGDAELFNASLIVKDSGIFTGSNNNLMPANVITRQQMAKVLVNGFGLKDLAGVESKVTDTDKAQAEYVNYINILSENGVTEVTAFNPTGAVKRGQMASFLNRSYDSAHKVVAPETATKVVSVSATNLVQAVITFDGTVDRATAEDHDNYTIVEVDDTSVSKDIKSAVLSADGKSVTLTLDAPTDDDEFANQEKYQLSFNNIKSGDKVLSVKDSEFTPVDAALPTVEGVQALGNKTIRVVFSEPVQKASPANFLVDGNTLIGNTKVSGNTVIVKLFSTLADGEHKVTVTGVEDHAGFKSLSKEVAFDVVKDETAPTASVENATFEYVTVKFSEAVDPETVLASNVYWLEGSTKRAAKAPVVQLSDDTFRFDFSDNKIQYTTDLYISGVKDYSGNAIAADTKVQVNPVLDRTNPTVINADLQADSKTINVKFSKAIEAASVSASDFVIKDADGKEYSKLKTVTVLDNKTVRVVLATALEEAETYKLEISGINDNTTLKNALLPYSKEFTVGDENPPELAADGAVVRNVANNSIVVTYPEVMSTSGDSSIVDRTKYSYKIGGSWKTLPASANLNVTSDGKSAVIGFPSSIKVADVTDIRVQLVKDAAGNYLKGLTQEREVADADDVVLEDAFATSKTSITADFDANLLSSTVTASDFTVTTAAGVELNVIGAALSSSDSSRVVLTLADSSKLNENGTHADNRAVTVKVKPNATTSTPAGKAIKVDAVGQVVDDKIKATIDKITGLANGSIQITFNEALDGSVTKDNAEYDLVIKKGSTTLAPNADYNIDAISGNNVVISFTQNRAGIVSVALPAPRVLQDVATTGKNVVAVSDTIEVEVKTLDNTVPTVSGVTEGGVYNTVTPTFTGTATLAKDGGTAVAHTSGTAINTAGDYVLSVTNAVGNVTTVNFKVDTTVPTVASATVTPAGAPGTTASIALTANEVGTYYYVVLASADAAPTAAQVVAQGTAVAKGTAAYTTANTVQNIAVTGLTASATYNAYVVVKDAAGNLSLVTTTPFTAGPAI